MQAFVERGEKLALKKGILVPKAEIRKMERLFLPRYGKFLSSLEPKLARAFMATAVMHGYEKTARLLDSLQKNVQVANAGNPKARTGAALNAIKEKGSSGVKQTSLSNVSKFAWGYYNKELGDAQVTTGESQNIYSQLEVGQGSKQEEGILPTQVQVERQKAVQRQVEQLEKLKKIEMGRLVKKQAGKPNRKIQGENELEARIVLQKRKMAREIGVRKGKGMRLQENKVQEDIIIQGKRDSAVAGRRDNKLQKGIELRARQALADAFAAGNMSMVLEFAVRKRREKRAGEKYSMKMSDEVSLLEINRKKARALVMEIKKQEKIVQQQIITLRKEIREQRKPKAKGKGTGASRMRLRAIKEKKKKLKKLLLKWAFLKKAKGALRRLLGGFFGTIGMLKQLLK